MYLLLRSEILGSKEPVRVDTQVLIGYATKENASSYGSSVRGSIYIWNDSLYTKKADSNRY